MYNSWKENYEVILPPFPQISLNININTTKYCIPTSISCLGECHIENLFLFLLPPLPPPLLGGVGGGWVGVQERTYCFALI